MDTKIYNLEKVDNLEDVYKEAGKIINDGGVVVFPTETVYGIGADATNEEAVKKIFKVKGRPSDNPLIVHVANVEMLKSLVIELNGESEDLIHKFFPGPLTLIMKKRKESVCEYVSKGLATIGIRMPKNQVALDFIKACDKPICAPSANISGRPSITSNEYLIEEFYGKVDMILLGGDCEIGLESTVLDISLNEYKLLRPGAITKEEIEEFLGGVIDSSKKIDSLKPKSPGMKYAHYKPKAKVISIKGEKDSIIKFINESTFKNKVGFLVREDIKEKIDNNNVRVKSLGVDIQSASKTLFKAFRDFDLEGVDLIYVESFDSSGIGLAYMNRLLKACENEVIVV